MNLNSIILKCSLDKDTYGNIYISGYIHDFGGFDEFEKISDSFTELIEKMEKIEDVE